MCGCRTCVGTFVVLEQVNLRVVLVQGEASAGLGGSCAALMWLFLFQAQDKIKFLCNKEGKNRK